MTSLIEPTHAATKSSYFFDIIVTEKGVKKSNSFVENTAQTLQSFDKNVPMSAGNTHGDVALDMTEDELAMFSKTKAKNTTEEDIVVRYSAPEAVNPMMLADQPPEPGYATVNEIVMLEQKKEKKQGRKVSKSIQKAMKPDNGKGSSKTQSPQGISGPEMGFKPQFHSNPLMKLGGSIPPTPPPTPATAASIAPSDESKSSYTVAL